MGIIAQILDYDQPHALLIYLVVVTAGMAVGILIWLFYTKNKERGDRARMWRLLDSFAEKPAGSVDSTLIMKKEVACPHCGGNVNSIDSICMFCGSNLDLGSNGGGLSGVVRREIVIEGVVAFHERELVQIESVKPDPDRPEFKYVVCSRPLGRRFRLSDDDVMA